MKRSDTTRALTVNYSVSGTASNNTDYDYLYNSVTFAVGEDTAYIVVHPKDDVNIENVETIVLTLYDPSVINSVRQYTLDESRRSASLNLIDNDIVPLVWFAGSENATEGVTNGRFILKRSDTTRALTVRYSVSGTASNNTDYDNLYGSVTFAEGEDTAYITVQPKDDLNVENTETIILTLSTPTTVGGVAQYALDPEKNSATLNLIDNDIAPLVWFAGVEDATEGISDGRFILKRNDTTRALTVNYSVSGTASNNTDYDYLYNSVTFAVGEDTAYIVVHPKDDVNIENVETIVLTLYDPSVVAGVRQYTLDESKRSASLNLIDNDIVPLVWFAGSEDAIEGVSTGRFILKRSDTTRALTVRYSISGTASNNTDYDNLYNSVTFAEGEDTAYIAVQPKDDLNVENTETIILTLSTPTTVNGVAQYALDPEKSSATLNLIDNDVAPLVWFAGVEDAIEGISDGRFILKRNDTTRALTVNYSVSGTASNNTDYDYLYNSVTFAVGEDTAYIVVHPKDDANVENVETIVLTLYDPSVVNSVRQYTLDESKRSASLNLIDNDIVPLVWFAGSEDATEGITNGRFILKRSDTTRALTIRYSVSGTASNNTDYDNLYGSVTFAEGEDTAYITVQPKDDLNVENTETIILTLSTPTTVNGVAQYALDPEKSSATLNLIDNDIAPLVWFAGVEDAIEGISDGRFILKRSDTTRALTVNYSVSGTASNNTDYDYLYNSVTFAVGEDTAYIVVHPKDDVNIENVETIVLTLYDPSVVNSVRQYTLDESRRSASLNLIDNDIAPLVWFAGSENATEGVTNGRFILKRSDTTRALMVRYSVSGTASNNNDYTYLYGTVTFAEGSDTAEIVLIPHDDNIVEQTKTIILTLSNCPFQFFYFFFLVFNLFFSVMLFIRLY